MNTTCTAPQSVLELRRSMPLEILHLALVLLGGSFRGKRGEIAPPSGAWIDLARIEPVFARFQLADHRSLRVRKPHSGLNPNSSISCFCSATVRSTKAR